MRRNGLTDVAMVSGAESCPTCRMYPWYENTSAEQDQWTRAMNKMQADATVQ